MRWSFFRSTAALAFAAVLIPGASAQTPQARLPHRRLSQRRTPPRYSRRCAPFACPRVSASSARRASPCSRPWRWRFANNKDIEASRIDREISGYSLTGARGLYDPTIGAVSQFLKQINPVASSLGGSATGAVLNRTWQTDPTLSGSTPWLGGSYHVDLSSQRDVHQ